MDRMNIAIALNRKMLKCAYVMIRSLVRNNDAHPICLYVLRSELEEDCIFFKDALQRDTGEWYCIYKN